MIYGLIPYFRNQGKQKRRTVPVTGVFPGIMKRCLAGAITPRTLFSPTGYKGWPIRPAARTGTVPLPKGAGGGPALCDPADLERVILADVSRYAKEHRFYLILCGPVFDLGLGGSGLVLTLK